jgi:hypothetical protein
MESDSLGKQSPLMNKALPPIVIAGGDLGVEGKTPRPTKKAQHVVRGIERLW